MNHAPSQNPFSLCITGDLQFDAGGTCKELHTQFQSNGIASELFVSKKALAFLGMDLTAAESSLQRLAFLCSLLNRHGIVPLVSLPHPWTDVLLQIPNHIPNLYHVQLLSGTQLLAEKSPTEGLLRLDAGKPLMDRVRTIMAFLSLEATQQSPFEVDALRMTERLEDLGYI